MDFQELAMTSTLIKNVDIVTLDDEGRILRNACIAIQDGVLHRVGEAPKEFNADDEIDADGCIAVPGLFNAHCHAAMTLERGWAEDLPFDRWLNEKIWVAESALEEEDVYWGAALAICEMIRAGVVGFADHYFWMEQVAKAVQESGIKALLAWCHFGIGEDKEVGGVNLETKAQFARDYDGAAEGRIRTAIGPHSP
jgi:5-methylthioadenosine/S-adenosylhomocysteine deaminase